MDQSNAGPVQATLDLPEPETMDEYKEAYGDDEGYEPDCMPQPTSKRPGPEKIHVLAMRFRYGRELWHPDDAPKQDGTPMDAQLEAMIGASMVHD